MKLQGFINNWPFNKETVETYFLNLGGGNPQLRDLYDEERRLLDTTDGEPLTETRLKSRGDIALEGTRRFLIILEAYLASKK